MKALHDGGLAYCVETAKINGQKRPLIYIVAEISALGDASTAS
jgi:hypothetical protein